MRNIVSLVSELPQRGAFPNLAMVTLKQWQEERRDAAFLCCGDRRCAAVGGRNQMANIRSRCKNAYCARVVVLNRREER